MNIGRLHVLTDFHFQQRLSHAGLAAEACAGGADTIQFRQKGAGIQTVLHNLRPVAAVCAEAGVPLIVNDRIDLMLAVDAGGVHLGQQDLPVDVVRRLVGTNKVIGATATTTDQALRAQELGADYIGFGPVSPTGSKANPASVKGLAGLERTAATVSIPVIAIGGITPDRVAGCLAAGAHGVAVMTAISTAPSPREVTTRFREKIEAALA